MLDASEFAEAAARYARMGLAVIPLKPKDKRPMFENWPEVATNDLSTVTRWWQQTPKANIGIATGPKSRVFALDVDPKNGGRETYDSLIMKHGRFPNTWQDITGSGGFHLFFRYPNFRVSNAASIFPGIDIRGEGGQVVAPPSIHPNGNRYEWDGVVEPWDDPNGLAEAPDWLLEALQGRTTKLHSDKFPLVMKIPKGVQHETLVSMAGMLRRLGLTPEEIFPSLMEVNKRRCTEPGPEQNIHQIAESMDRYRPSDSDLISTANRLWRVTKARECEAEREKQKHQVEVVDGLSVYRAPAVDQTCVVDGLLYNGLTVFAGRPKVGKSWLMLQLALAVSHGGRFLNLDVLRPGAVAYFALEESQARTGRRMRQMWPEEDVLLQNISMVYSLSPLMAEGRKQLEELLKNRRPNLVIIDTFLALVGAGGKRSDVLRSEYAEINILHEIAQELDTAIVLVHHLRKGQIGESGLDAVAGSTGVTAAADSIWTMKREDQELCSLEVVGRDAGEQTLALRFTSDPIGWEFAGMGESIKDTKDEREILTLLRNEGVLGVARVATLLKMNANRARSVLYSMNERGLVHRNSSGGYYANKCAAPEEVYGEQN